MKTDRNIPISECLTQEQSNYLLRVFAIQNCIYIYEIEEYSLISYLQETCHMVEPWVLGNPVFKKELYSILIGDEYLVNFFFSLGDRYKYSDLFPYLTDDFSFRDWIEDNLLNKSIRAK